MARVLGAPVTNVRRSTVGSSHAVFVVELADGRRGVARVATHPEHAIGRELWATEMARTAGVPAPRLLGADLHPRDGGPPIAVHELLLGEPGHQVELTAADRMGVLEEMGRIAARLDRVRVPGVGGLTPAGDGYAGSAPSWADFVERALDRRLGELRALGAAALPARTARAIRSRFAAARPLFEAVLPAGAPSSALVHGDFRLENALLVRDAAGVRVSAVLDFEMALAGDGVVDLAWLDYEDGRGPDDLAAILRGRGDDPTDAGLRERLRLHQIHYALGHLWWEVSFRDRGGAASVRRRIDGLLAASS